MKEDANEPAFPVDDTRGNPWRGLTKREYFAAAALTGACALSQSLGDSGMCGMTASEAAAFAVAAADETLRELSKDPQQNADV